jgi:hypothetical protein
MDGFVIFLEENYNLCAVWIIREQPCGFYRDHGWKSTLAASRSRICGTPKKEE